MTEEKRIEIEAKIRVLMDELCDKESVENNERGAIYMSMNNAKQTLSVIMRTSSKTFSYMIYRLMCENHGIANDILSAGEIFCDQEEKKREKAEMQNDEIQIINMPKPTTEA